MKVSARFGIWTTGLLLAVALPAWGGPPLESSPYDWPHWRGPEMNGISREVGLIDSWSLEGENLLWTNEELGTRSSPIVMNGKVYTIIRSDPETPQEGETVCCADAETGKIVWRNRFNVFLSDVPGERVGWSSVVGDPTTGKVYALGVCGWLQCLDADSGKTLWARSMSEEFGLLSTYGGRTNFPFIIDDLVVVSAIVIGWGDMAKPAHRFLAFDKETGDVVWFNGTRLLPYDTTYSSPVLSVIDGKMTMVFGSGDGAVWAMQPRTGVPLWNFQLSRRGLNVTPLVVGNQVFTGQSEENVDDNTMGSIVAINALGKGDITSSGEIWRRKEQMMGKSSPIIVDGRLICIEDNGRLRIVDPKTGKTLNGRGRGEKLGTVMRSSPVYADGKIYLSTANGRWYILEIADDKVKKLNYFRLPTGASGSVAISKGRIYVPTEGALYCLGKRNHTPKIAAAPIQTEAAVQSDPKPAHLQVVPNEMLLRPGDSAQFTARLFNSRGQFLKTVPASFSIEGKGTISAGGKFTAANAGHHAVSVTAQSGDIQGTARVRVVPPLPWKFDFSDGEVPITWVGARYRHVINQDDGDNVLMKRNDIPKGTRSQSWMGHIDLHDYTVQADVKGDIKDDKRPDIGLIAQRYTLDLMGEKQELQIRTWPTQLRMARSAPFQWEPNVWYTMKFKAANEEGKAVLRGKVWKRGTVEPDEWTVVAEDTVPNRVGSPGLFGNAKDAVIYYDNISVTKN